jgi:hypothetical protein
MSPSTFVFPNLLPSILATALLSVTACGTAEEDRREPTQGSELEATTRIIGSGDFTVNKPIINRLWGSSDNDVWAAGNDGNMLHWNGKAWRRIAVPTGNDLLGIWGASDKDVWAVGEAGIVIHWDGTAWTRVTSPVPDSAALNDIWGSSASNIWAVGDRGVLVQYNGSAWGAFSLPAINNLLTVWSNSTNASAFFAIRGTASNKVWAAKQNREIWQFDGTKWSPVTSVVGTKLWMTADNNIWVYDLSTAFHFTTTWKTYTFGTISAIWSPSPMSAWTFTPSDIFRFAGGAWSAQW